MPTWRYFLAFFVSLLLVLPGRGDISLLASEEDYVGNWREDWKSRNNLDAFMDKFGLNKDDVPRKDTYQNITYSDGVFNVSGTTPKGCTYRVLLDVKTKRNSTRNFSIFGKNVTYNALFTHTGRIKTITYPTDPDKKIVAYRIMRPQDKGKAFEYRIIHIPSNVEVSAFYDKIK